MDSESLLKESFRSHVTPKVFIGKARSRLKGYLSVGCTLTSPRLAIGKCPFYMRPLLRVAYVKCICINLFFRTTPSA